MLLQKSCFQLLPYDSNISHGNVTSNLRCAGNISDSAIANFLLILTVKTL